LTQSNISVIGFSLSKLVRLDERQAELSNPGKNEAKQFHGMEEKDANLHCGVAS